MDTIILDMEWNQPFSKKRMVKSPVCLTGEIIQIGVVKLDKNYCIVDTFNDHAAILYQNAQKGF